MTPERVPESLVPGAPGIHTAVMRAQSHRRAFGVSGEKKTLAGYDGWNGLESAWTTMKQVNEWLQARRSCR